MAYETLRVETQGPVGLITLHRPKALNALNRTLLEELARAVEAFDAAPGIGCLVLTGGAQVFAAGADIREMQPKSYMEVFGEDLFANAECLARCRTPVVAAVAGYALGGGCELAMMCDIIICADTARFGQPEITLGVQPGIGGTQRLTRLVGKARAMDMCLTGRLMEAEEAQHAGLVSRVVPADALQDTALEVARGIADKSRPIAMMVKESVNRASETTLAEGLLFERRTFHAMFATEDRAEGMAAFLDKRPPKFRHR